MNNPIRNARVVLAVLAALLAALVVSACGGSSGTSASAKSNTATTTATTASAARTAFAACLKTHGVKLAGNGVGGGRGFPGDGTRTIPGGPGTPSAGAAGAPPSGGGPGGAGGFPRGGFAGGNSKFAKAFQACRSKLGGAGFGGGFGARPGTAGGGAGALQPRFTTAVLKSYVACIRRDGYAAMPEPKAAANGSFFPASVEKNTNFQAANRKCQSILFKSLRRSTAGAGAGTGADTITGTSTASA
jgi:hypothetical protein